jgi:hypothetical protein
MSSALGTLHRYYRCLCNMHCALTDVQILTVKAAYDGGNSMCSYDNVTVGSLVN